MKALRIILRLFHFSIALRLNTKTVIKKFQIHYLDRNSSIETIEGISMNETFAEFKEKYSETENCLELNETKNFNLQINYSPRNRISAIDLVFEDILAENPKSMKVSVDLYINNFRDCIIYNKYYRIDGEILTFICESKSLVHYRNETIPQSFQFTFKSEKIFKLRICEISVYQFQDNCGVPDIPIPASIQDYGKTINFYPTPQRKKYRMIGDDTINCVFEGNWDKEPPIFKPVIQCDIKDIDLNSSIYKSIKLQNLEFFNETEVAVIDSKIEFQCNNAENSSKIFISFCDENGLWIGDDYKCE
jgi:hypothetical protein